MKGISASIYREYINRMTSPRVLVENILNPLFTLFIFGVALGNAIGYIKVSSMEIPYITFFLVGAINISLITNAVVAATKTFLDKYVGLFEEMMTYPVNRTSILLGKLIFSILISFIQALAMIVFVFILFPGKIVISSNILLFFLIVIVGAMAWFLIITYLALRLKTQDGFNTVYYLIMTPLLYTSSIYYPVDSMPVIIKYISIINPLTWLTDVGRFYLLNLETAYLSYKIIGLLVFTGISFLLAAREMNRYS